MEVAFSTDGRSLAVATWLSDPHGTFLWSIPTPSDIGLSDEEMELRVQLLTRTAMDANGVLSQLDRATWEACHARLREVVKRP
jgi:hypothetical protein